jgi:hypothetical protein
MKEFESLQTGFVMTKYFMNTEQQNLWCKIKAFQIGQSDASLTFAQRLAREHAWTAAYAERVISEYKRFVFLAAVSRQELTPSDQVDQAWHLHLGYTKSYWRALCQETLKLELHHNPTLGGEAEQQRFKKQYADTLRFYEAVFNQPPPYDIWPCVEKRFESVDGFIRINRHQSWIIAKPKPAAGALFFAATLGLVLVSCTHDLAQKDIWFWLKVILGVFVIYKVISWLLSQHNGKSSGGGGGCGGFGGDSGGGDGGGGGCGGG